MVASTPSPATTLVVLHNDYELHRVDAPNGAVEIHGKIEADRIEAASVSADGSGFAVRVVGIPVDLCR